MKNSYGILEPVPDPSALVEPAKVDLAVVPGVVFDRANHRLGRGRGFYDRFLKKLKAGTPKVGLAYAFQVVETVPVDTHDVRLDQVLTD
ncbi:MAG: 5-formyltetrahydrofolate cyclo-ligase [Candidatus Omnitrophica bacterium]|nr:5-formyltetrahydrofolate cyclo-ligase [Candidatus Omnitrophota bacterium]